jgi:hypothetical protein
MMKMQQFSGDWLLDCSLPGSDAKVLVCWEGELRFCVMDLDTGVHFDENGFIVATRGILVIEPWTTVPSSTYKGIDFFTSSFQR